MSDWGRHDRARIDYHKNKMTIPAIRSKYGFTEEEANKVLAVELTDRVAQVKARAERAFEKVIDDYYGVMRSDALKKFKELMDE